MHHDARLRDKRRDKNSIQCRFDSMRGEDRENIGNVAKSRAPATLGQFSRAAVARGHGNRNVVSPRPLFPILED
jgi:hypothetical protein